MRISPYMKGELSSYKDDITQDMVLRLNAYVWEEKLQDEQVTLTVLMPATWWDHFKEDYFPCWLEELFPVDYAQKTSTHQFKTVAKFPDFAYEPPKNLGKYVYETRLINRETPYAYLCQTTRTGTPSTLNKTERARSAKSTAKSTRPRSSKKIASR